MRNFLLSSLLLALFSCSRPVTHSALEEKVMLRDSSLVSPFANGFSSYFFKVKSDIYGHYLSGLLLIKPIRKDDYRIVFTTEVGVTLFDFECSRDSFLVHYCIDKLNRKAVIRTLQKDFRLILMNDLEGKEAFITNSNSETATRVPNKKEEDIYFSNAKDGSTIRIEKNSKKGAKKVLVEMKQYERHFPHVIHIAHQNIQLTIDLTFIER